MYDWDKSLDEIARYTGRHVRPSLVQSKYNVVKIVFNVSSDRVYSPVGYLGFKIRFHSEPSKFSHKISQIWHCKFDSVFYDIRKLLLN